MKHKFQCGIVGESHDGAGDIFLAGLMRRLADGEQVEIWKKRALAAESELRQAQRVIAALCHAQGGEISFSDFDRMATIGGDLIRLNDDATRRTIFRIRLK